MTHIKQAAARATNKDTKLVILFVIAVGGAVPLLLGESESAAQSPLACTAVAWEE